MSWLDYGVIAALSWGWMLGWIGTCVGLQLKAAIKNTPSPFLMTWAVPLLIWPALICMYIVLVTFQSVKPKKAA